MSISSFGYLVFVVFSLLISSFLGHNTKKNKLFLTAISYYFYATFDLRFCLILFAVTLANFFIGKAIARTMQDGQRKLLLGFVVCLDIGVLFLFKYLNFFLDSLAPIIGADALHGFVGLLLPVGISFFIFQALTYPLDLYRGDVAESRSFLDFAFFIAFFPQLLVGPIVRASYFLPQLRGRRALIDEDYRQTGFALILMGLIKKVALADVLAAHMVDPAFANPDGLSPLFLLVALIAYSFQIYMDLSGYTDMARGVGRLFGYELPINFDRPYHAPTVSNFWQRWHITMSSFFRDYLYFGLGGSKKGNVYVNIVLTFVAIGLWHGAGWSFVIYGFCHGSMVAYERVRRNRRRRLGLPEISEGLLTRIWAVGSTFAFVSLTRLLFRGGSLEDAWHYAKAMGNWEALANQPYTPLGLLALFSAIGLHLTPPRWRDHLITLTGRRSAVSTALILTGTVLVLLAVAEGARDFIYFRF